LAFSDGGDPLEDTTISEDLLQEDDILNDDEDLDEKSLLDVDGHEEAILRTPPKSVDKEPVTDESAVEKPAPKKVSLKRNISISAPVLPVPVEKAAEATPDDSDSDATAKKVVKLTELTAEERKNLRAQKFGDTKTLPAAVLTSDAKKDARAARFGLSASTDDAKGNTTTSAASSEALKKRAERFGVTVSTELQKLENKDKLAKRQERFGVGTASTVVGGGANKADYAEKARLRAERFKTAA
jgi:SAP domain-containing ribonucleoprotein